MKELGQNAYVYGTKLFSFSGKPYNTRTLSSLSLKLVYEFTCLKVLHATSTGYLCYLQRNDPSS